MKFLIILILSITGCSFNMENDIFGSSKNRDMLYSNGIHFNYAKHASVTPELLKKKADPIPSFDLKDNNLKPNKYTFEIGQEMYTPDDLSVFELQPDRNPYVGVLFGRVGKEEITTEYRKHASLMVGTVGPNSYADKTQTWFHDKFGMQHPNGWDNQISNEIVFMHDTGIELRDIQIKYGNTKFEQSSGYNLKLGTWYTGLELNLTHRFGQNYELFSMSQKKSWSWYVYNTPYIQGVVRDMVLDGNTFKDSHSVDKEPIVYGNETGIALEFKGYSLKLYNKTQSKLFEKEDKPYHTWGGFVISKLFDLY